MKASATASRLDAVFVATYVRAAELRLGQFNTSMLQPLVSMCEPLVQHTVHAASARRCNWAECCQCSVLWGNLTTGINLDATEKSESWRSRGGQAVQRS